MASPQPTASTSAASSPQASGSSTPASSTHHSAVKMQDATAAPSSELECIDVEMTASPAQKGQGEKRKASDSADSPASDAKKPKVITNTSANSTPKPASKDMKGKGKSVPSSTVKEDSVPLELKLGKLVNKQKPLKLSGSMSATRARLEFTEWVSNKINEDEDFKLSDWPTEHHSIIAAIIQDSPQTLAGLVTSTKNEIVGAVQGALGAVVDSQDEDSKSAGSAIADRIPSAPIKALIESIATRSNYGLEVTDLPDGLPEGVKEMPATLQIIAWEVNDASLLPSEFEKQLHKRKNEREQMKTLAVDLFLALSASEQGDALRSKKPSKKAGGGSTSTASASKKASAPSSSSSAKPAKEKATKKVKTQEELDEAEAKAKAKAAKEEEKEQRRLAKEAAAKEKEEKKIKIEQKKAAKAAEEAEKLAKEEKAKNLKKAQANFMNAFVKKEKKSQSPALDGSTSGKKESDFNRVFHPFTIRADVTLAPTNRFPKGKAAAKGKGPEVKINSAASEEMDDEGKEKWRKNALKAFVADVPKHHIPHYNPHPSPPVSVRETVVAINESLLTGIEARDCYSALKDRSKISVKLIKFSTDVRPGYVGTWTKKSKFIGPRTPFARDTQLLNYDVDSEEEWEEEVDDPDAEDVNSDAGRSDDDGEESEALSDDWMCEDDEVEYAPGFNADDEMMMPEGDDDLIILGDDSTARRKVEQRERKAKAAKEGAKKRKAVGPLLQLVKGPFWETELGETVHPPFHGMKIHFLNDAYVGLDPFSFISKPFTSASAASKGKGVDTDSPAADNAVSPSGSTSLERKASTNKPPKPIPAHLMPQFIQLVDDNGSLAKPVLIQAIYDALKKVAGDLKISKTMIQGAFVSLPVVKTKGDDPKAPARYTIPQATRDLHSAPSAMVVD